MNFKQQYTLQKRIEERTRINENYPDRVPIIIERSGVSVAALEKKKYLVPVNTTVGQLSFIIRKKITLTPEKAMFLFINGLIPPNSAPIGEVYSKQADPDDGFLYVLYSGESTFGN